MTPTEKYIAIKQAEIKLFPNLTALLTRNINEAINMLPKGQLRLEL